MIEENQQKEYLGDSVYIELENGMLKLYTYNGIGLPSNVIYLDDETLNAFISYVKRITGNKTL